MSMNLLRRIFPPSGYRFPLLSYPVVFALMAVELVLLLRGGFGYVNGGDSFDYIDAVDVLLSGRPDLYRTPPYPAALAVLRWVFGPALMVRAMQVTQCVVAVVGAWWFMRVAGRFTFGRRRATFWLTAVYALNPYWNMWVMHTMTEVFAMAGSVALLWCMVRDLPGRPSVRSGVWAGLWLVFLVLLRPILLCWLPVAAVWWWARFRATHARGAVVALWLAAAVPPLLGGYVAWFGHTYGVYKVSAVSTWNRYALAHMAGVMRPGYTDNPVLQRKISEINASSDTVLPHPLMLNLPGMPMAGDSITQAEIELAVDRAIADNPAVIVRYMDARLRYLVWNEPMLWSGRWLPSLRVIDSTLRLKMGVYLLFLAAFGIWLCVQWRRGLRPAGSWLCWLLCVALAGAAALGAQDNWVRLTLPSMPAAMMLVYQMLSMFPRINDKETKT